MTTEKRRDVDLLIEEFWRKGYLTVFRKFGTYLPEPSNIGGFDVDADQDFKDPSFIKNKLSYLAQRQTKGSSKKVMLFVGVSVMSYKYAKTLIDELDPETRKNIRLFQIVEKQDLNLRNEAKSNKVLFS